MSESKQQEAEDAVQTRPKVDVLAVEIAPNPAALTDSLRLKVDFHLEAPVANGVWHIEVSANGRRRQADCIDLFVLCRFKSIW